MRVDRAGGPPPLVLNNLAAIDSDDRVRGDLRKKKPGRKTPLDHRRRQPVGERLQRAGREDNARLLLELSHSAMTRLLELAFSCIGRFDLATGEYPKPGHMLELITALEEKHLTARS